MKKVFRVTLYNQHASCGVVARGRYPLAAYRNAVKAAGNEFLFYRGSHSVTTDDFKPLFEHARKSFRKCPLGRVHISFAGLGVELYAEQVTP